MLTKNQQNDMLMKWRASFINTWMSHLHIYEKKNHFLHLNFIFTLTFRHLSNFHAKNQTSHSNQFTFKHTVIKKKTMKILFCQESTISIFKQNSTVCSWIYISGTRSSQPHTQLDNTLSWQWGPINALIWSFLWCRIFLVRWVNDFTSFCGVGRIIDSLHWYFLITGSLHWYLLITGPLQWYFLITVIIVAPR